MEVAAKAVSLIDDSDTVAVESGSTAVEVAKALLKTDLNITIITHSNTVFNILKTKFKVVLIGGEYMAEDDCFGDILTENFLRKFHVNKALVFPSAISVKHGIESFFLPVVPIERIFKGQIGVKESF